MLLRCIWVKQPKTYSPGNEISHSTSLSSILAHKRETGHRISFDDFSVLASGHSELDTVIQRSLLIAKINPSLNVNIR